MGKERNTEQKNILIKYLCDHKNEHLMISDIQEDLAGKVGQTTIYRMMNSLIEKGTVTKIALENKQGFCYKYNDKSEKCCSHYHLICEKCNKLTHFESKQIPKVEAEAESLEDFTIDNDRVVFYGICNDCKKGLKK